MTGAVFGTLVVPFSSSPLAFLALVALVDVRLAVIESVLSKVAVSSILVLTMFLIAFAALNIALLGSYVPACSDLMTPLNVPSSASEET